MTVVLCNEELQQWSFVSKIDCHNTEYIEMTQSGDLVRQQTVNMNIRDFIIKLEGENWRNLSTPQAIIKECNKNWN